MSRRVPAEFHDWPVTLPVLYGPYRAVVRYIVDGDTIDVMVDVGLNDYPYRTLRLLADYGDAGYRGIDTPESNRLATKVAGLAAKAFTESLAPVGAQVLVTTEPDPDSFGRYLAVVRLSDGRDVGRALLRAGHATLREYKLMPPVRTGRGVQ